MRIVNDEPADPHANLKALSAELDEGTSTGDSIDSLRDEIRIFEE